jgi:uncharacterized protein with FMN-binding domain
MKQMLNARRAIGLVLLLCSALTSTGRGEDVVEFLSGAKARGTVKEIRRDKKEFDLEVRLGTRRSLRTFRFDRVHAVTMNGKRYVLTEKESTPGDSADGGSGTLRTRAEVLELINTLGRTPPDWLASTPLDYPPTLELDWPIKPDDKGWNNQKNVGQYKWDIINPNPGRWRSGLRLIYEIMSLHKDDPPLLRRDMTVIAEMYFELFQDYVRAAFWLQQADAQLPQPQGVRLAECYWRLGNKQMALQMLNTKRLPVSAIKLLGDLGQTDRATKLAESFARSRPQLAHEPYLLAGDACRLAGRYEEAIRFYQRVLQADKARNEDYEKIYMGRAQDSIEAIELFDKADVTQVADGSYEASSTGYNGPLKVKVEVAGGKIINLRVTEHQEKQFYAALTDTPTQILKKQSVQGIDATSRATITSQAIVNSTAKALAKGASGTRP